MDKLKKVIKGLDCCTGTAVHLGHCQEGCPYFAESERADKCVEKLHHDALELLKSAYPEPHCLTLEEAENVCHDTVCEFRYGIEPTRFPPKVIKAWINGVKYRYGKTWRCWTERPTDEQRRETPWAE